MNQKYKAYLVWSTVGTRVVAPVDATDEEVYALAHKRLVENLDTSGIELCESIFEDTEVPFDSGISELDQRWVDVLEKGGDPAEV